MVERVRGGLPVQVRAVPDGQEVAIAGLVDVHSVPDLRLLLHEVIDTGTGDVLLRLEGAEIGDATGLGVVVEAYTRARRAGRRLAVVSMTERTARLLRASRLHRALVLGDPVPGTGVAPLTA